MKRFLYKIKELGALKYHFKSDLLQLINTKSSKFLFIMVRLAILVIAAFAVAGIGE